MPELPEVETTLSGIKPFILHQKIVDMEIRHFQLRWPVPKNLKKVLTGQIIEKVERRGKYLLLKVAEGTLLIHLGMSGSLRIVPINTPAKKHDHIDIIFANQHCLRFTDPRRFGAVLFTTSEPAEHELISHLGPEPLTPDFSARYLWDLARGRKAAVKTFIMDGQTVVGVGNIYAAEALFMAGIHPNKPAGKVSLASYEKLEIAIRKVLGAAIKQGGTTLKDFVNSDGKKGYFKVHLQVYGRSGEKCLTCGTTLKGLRLDQRSTVYCPICQRR